MPHCSQNPSLISNSLQLRTSHIPILIIFISRPLSHVQGMEYLHGRGIAHGLLSSHSISLHCRVCISLAPQYSRSDARQLEPCKIPYLPPECVRELRASQCRSRETSCDNVHKSYDTSCDQSLSQCRSRDLPCDYGRRRVHSCGGEHGGCGLSERRVCKVQLKGRPTLSADVFAFG